MTKRIIDEPTVLKLGKVINRTIRYTECGDIFKHPVDRNQNGFTDYDNIVKNPMDFKTLLEKLSYNKYESLM